MNWTHSKVEEVISVLWIIAGLLAWIASFYWLAVIFFVKAAIDTFFAIYSRG